MLVISIWTAFLTVQVYQNSFSEDVPFSFADGLFSVETVIILAAAVLISLLFGTEYTDGTIHNKLIGGYTRGRIYMAEFAVNAVACLLVYASSIIISGILGFILMGADGVSGVKVAVYVLAGMLMCVADAAVFTFITMAAGSKAGAAVAGLLLAFALLCGAMVVRDKLSEEKYNYIPKDQAEDASTVVVTEETELVKVPNPFYISGKTRRIYEFLLDINPAGQAVQLSAFKLERPAAAAVYSCVIIIVFCGAGVMLFRRKDLK